MVAGIITGVVPMIINHGAYALNLNSLRWADFMGKFLLGTKPVGPAEFALTVVAEFILLGLFGTVFSLITPHLSSVNYLVKGLAFGAFIWLFSYFLTNMFHLPGLMRVPVKTVITHLIAGLLWGLALSVALNWLDHRIKTQ
ncbi:MAG TPA: hypothetical protein PKY23_10870 [Bacillota bacterium]|nr:hypothetical protein [Bacillota bacterium]